MQIINNYIDGDTVEIKSERFSDVFNPSTGKVIAKVGLSNDKEVDTAVTSSKIAFEKWTLAPTEYLHE